MIEQLMNASLPRRMLKPMLEKFSTTFHSRLNGLQTAGKHDWYIKAILSPINCWFDHFVVFLFALSPSFFIVVSKAFKIFINMNEVSIFPQLKYKLLYVFAAVLYTILVRYNCHSWFLRPPIFPFSAY